MKLSTLCLTLCSFHTPVTAFTVLPRVPTSTSTSTTALSAANVGVFFGTSTGSTQEVADLIAEKLGLDDGPIDVDDGDSVVEAFQKYDALIVGTPTWNTGE